MCLVDRRESGSLHLYPFCISFQNGDRQAIVAFFSIQDGTFNMSLSANRGWLQQGVPFSSKWIRERLRAEAGYTLTEMMIVLVVIGILTLIALPKFMSVTTKAKMTEAKTQLRHLHTLQKSHYYERDRYAEELSTIGFEQQTLVTDDGTARYKISIEDASTTGYTAVAEAVVDFDNDGTHNVWEVDETGEIRQRVAD